MIPQSSVELALCDFQFFTEYKLGLKLWKCQKVWADKVQSCIDGDYRGLQLLAPADHGKTSRIVIPLILWLLARDKANRIILVGNTDDYAEQIGRAVKTRIERMAVLSREFGLERGIKWSDSEIHVNRPNWEEKDPSLLCLGAGADVQSQRGDFLITDDLATRRNSRTESQRSAIQSYYFTDLDSRLDEKPYSGKGKILTFGHRVEVGDLYTVNEGRDGWLYHTDQAILEDQAQSVLAPEHHTYARLSDKRSKDPIGFEMMYQQRTAAMGRYVTRTAMDNARRPEMSFCNSLNGEQRSGFMKIWLAVDPAFSVNRWSKFSVFELWGLRSNGIRTLLWGMRDKLTPESLTNIMEMKFRLYMPDAFCIEGNQGQILLLPHMKRKFPDHVGKFKTVYTTNPDGRLETELGIMFNLYSGDKTMIELPYKGITEQSFVHAMTEEYTMFPDGKTRDIVMAQYIGEKGMGMIAEERRTGHVLRNGVLGAVAGRYRSRFNSRRNVL